jgi:zinc/manganese transport system permease protein
MSVLGDVFGLGDMLSHPFMRNAFLAGTAIAFASGLVGYFLVLRSQVFTVDALSHAAFAGALGALAFGFDARVGLFLTVLAVAALIGALGDHGKADDITIGVVFVWILGLGVLFLSLFTANRATTNSTAGVSVLFGSIFGLDNNRTIVAAIIASLVCVAMIIIARPLLFLSIDHAVAAARGVPVGPLGYAFLALVALTAGEATQAIGALLLLGLLAAPAAAAQRLTARPYVALVLSPAIAVAATWVGLLLSYHVPKLPPSSAIIATVTVAYVLCAAGTSRTKRRHAVRQPIGNDPSEPTGPEGSWPR